MLQILNIMHHKISILLSTTCIGLFFFNAINPLIVNSYALNEKTSWQRPDETVNDSIAKQKQIIQADKEVSTGYIFDHTIQEAVRRDYHTLPLGECMGKIGQMLIGTKYVGGTLEEIPEKCVLDLNGLDCVTFFENSLNIARALKIKQTEFKKNPFAVTFQDVLDQIEYTRYLDGSVDGFTSRLHYTSQWIKDNEKKGVVKDITKSLGGKPIVFNVSFMSTNPQYYPQLVSSEWSVKRMKLYEYEVNEDKHWYIPNAQVKDIESKLQTGDIIAITTNKAGLDYSHTGMIIKNDKGMALFLHASSAKKRVYLDKRISTYLAGTPTSTGITVLRPIDPSAKSEEE